MSTLPYQLIKGKGYITPEVEKTISHGMSYGLSSCGYDVRAKKSMWLWPLWGRLNVTIEKFNMPNDLVALVRDKSSLARRFIFVQNTVIEPGWRGNLTLELTRYLPWPVKIHAGQPIAQIMFEELSEPTEKPYDGKYQDQIDEPVPSIKEITSKDQLNNIRDKTRKVIIALEVIAIVIFLIILIARFY